MTQSITILVDKSGTGAQSLQHLIKSLRRLNLDASFHRIRKEQLAQGALEKTDLLIVPGGRDFLYHQSLGPEGASYIADYVHSGGRYLGICAGAYYACSRVHFGVGHGNAVWGARQMGFFSGIAEGPALGNVPYDFLSTRYCEVVKLRLSCEFSQTSSAWAYYNSGARFVPKEKSPQHVHFAPSPHWPWRELASYDDERVERPATAIVESWPGEGYALLSGVHPEMLACEFQVTQEAHDLHLKLALEEHQASMQELFKALVQRALTMKKKS